MAREIKTKEQRKAEKESALRSWIETKVNLSNDWIDNEKTQSKRGIIRGGVYMCQLGENIGTEQGEHRPVLVVSNDLINSTSGNVSVIPLTKNLKKKVLRDKEGKVKEVLNKPQYRSHYFLLKRKYTFLEHDSAVLGEETKTVSKVRIGDHKGDISPGDLDKIITRVKWVFGI
ncbi:mRNA interferase MazF [Evansella vedderi]|uniref:mRNA interferase MazF n=1 Tax=Evansella vedderi TaxID=38282 RepID=A0ABU0A387_9BACI|nr:type II toxin-antitoxin system PemK/MazF family toxin [Evansella vedderi]MDQ0257956.1 mRNA interferase MazF [Evansella vedderi]